jgi:hypothetical protein
MITFIRTAVGMPGKALEMAAFAKDMAAIINRVTGGNTTACVSFGGNANAVAWISHADSFTQMEETAAKLTADPEYRAALKKAEHLAVPGMTQDQFWRHI